MDVFAALADPVRRDLLRQVATAPQRVVDLAAAHDISRPAISRHLRVLSAAGLVDAEERGRERHYRVRPDALAPVSQLVAELRRRQPFVEHDLAGLDLEVRRVGRDRRTTSEPNDEEHTA